MGNKFELFYLDIKDKNRRIWEYLGNKDGVKETGREYVVYIFYISF